MEGKYAFCHDCNAPCARDFRRVADLSNSGLVIYVHKRKDSLQWTKEPKSDTDETYILHNTTGIELKNIDYIGELHRYQAKCFQCKRVVQRVRSLLDELTDIRENQVLGICEHCKRCKSTKTCPRCDYMLKKFSSDKARRGEERQRRFKVWLCRVRHLLQAILDGRNVCQHRVDQDPVSNLELRNLLRQLKAPLAVHEPTSEFFPVEKDLASLQNLTESKEIIDELILKLAQPNKHYTSDDSLYPFTSKMCICKYFMDKKFTGELPELDFGNKAKKAVGRDRIVGTGLGAKDNRGVEESFTDGESGKTGHMVSGKMSAYEKQKDGGRIKSGSSSRRLKGMMSAHEQQDGGEITKSGGVGRRLKGRISAHDNYGGSTKAGAGGRRLKGTKSAHDKQKVGEISKSLSAGQKSKGKIRSPDRHQKSKEAISKQEKKKGGEKGKVKAVSPDNKSDKKTDIEAKPEEELTILKSLKERRLSRKEGKHQSTEMTEEEKIFFKLMQEFKMQKHDKQVGTPHKHEKERRPTHIASLPALKRKEHKSLRDMVEVVESFMECDHIEEPPEMIKDTEIVPYDPHYKDKKKGSKVPLLFEMYSPDFACPEPEPPTPSPTSMTEVKRSKSSRIFKSKGAFSYVLSERYFIDQGITKLPTEKIMRKMNIYKMEPKCPNWFERNKSLTKYYNTGEILAEVNEDGSGKWFYKNGVVALDCHNAEDSNVGQRYVIYSTGKDSDTGKRRTQTVLASFDFHGNGVVYDHDGNIRLKYNQSEGVIVDGKIAPPGKWQWHTLNDPPVLQRLFINTNLKNRDPILETFHELQHQDTNETTVNLEQEALMLTIELDNFVKEKAHKLLQKFKPFHIRMKAVKLNNHFSVKILDQANITILFRDAATSLKLNVGMSLISNEIIDTDTAEVSEVSTPYDKRPPKTKSVANIQKMIDRVRKAGKIRASVL